MKKTILILFIIIVLIFISSFAITYSAVIEVVNDDNVTKIVNNLTLKDLVIDNNNLYNKTYYDVRKTLNVSEEEMDILLNSTSLNNSLKIVLKSVVDYKLHNKDKMTNNEIYELIVMSINEDDSIDVDLGNKVINKSEYYKNDISNFLYDIEVSIVGTN